MVRRATRRPCWPILRRLALALTLACAPPWAVAAPLAALGVALGGAADGAADRVTVTFDRAPAFTLSTLNDPPRVVVDLPLTEWRADPPAAGLSAAGPGLARGVRFGLAAPGRSRLVVDLAGPARTSATLEPGAVGVALTLTLRAQDAAAFAAGAAAAPPPPAAPQRAPIVAIDPGHGGIDPGAAQGGLIEKDVTLAHAQALRAALERAGLRVALTRDADVFLGLGARVALARAAGAEVLVSLHADAVPQPDVAGVSVYTLSARASDADAAALAARENRAELALDALFPGVESDIAHALLPRMRRETAAASARLGAALATALASAAPLLPGRPLRAAGFQVLRAPDMPAALIELGFLSSAGDRARLTDPAAIAAAAQALAAGIRAWLAAQDDAAAPQYAAE